MTTRDTFPALLAKGRLAIFSVTALLLTGTAFAQGSPSGFYVGAGAGDSLFQQNYFDYGTLALRGYPSDRLGWKLIVGDRPLSWFGGELEYIDFGRAHLGPSTFLGGTLYSANTDANAAAAFAVGYLPLGSSRFDLFAKLGAARLWNTYSYAGDYPTTFVGCQTVCPPVGRVSVSQRDYDDGLAYGVGAQAHFGAFAVRAEYEGIDSGVGDPNLFSLSLTWSFL